VVGKSKLVDIGALQAARRGGSTAAETEAIDLSHAGTSSGGQS
jgi:hypothetical protein